MMVKARYAVTTGLAGLYMPDCHHGAHLFTTRKELVGAIEDYIEFMEFPRSLRREVRVNRIWAFLKHHGASTAHFSIQHKGHEIAFHGLTEAEYDDMVKDDDL